MIGQSTVYAQSSNSVNATAITVDELLEQSSSMTDEELEQALSTMSTAELNELIDEIKTEVTNEKSRAFGFYLTKAAWLAASGIAKNKGYTCAGTLVEYSVKNKNYIVNRGEGSIFINKIKPCKDYTDYMKKVNLSSAYIGNFVFNKANNSDLFYALHGVTITTTPVNGNVAVAITDVFDFKYDNYVGDLFTSMVNNWAWLCQNVGVLNPIDVKINFYA